MLLRDRAYSVIGEANDGERALEMCLQQRPDIAFIDIDMPKLDGNQVVKNIREVSHAVGIVMISAVATLENVQRAMRVGANAFVVKPFNTLKVVEAIDRCLKKPVVRSQQ